MASMAFQLINESRSCYVDICSERSIDHCEKLIDLGVESTGFLSSEHFYDCDGLKVADNCVEKKKVVDNRTGFWSNQKCEGKR